MHDTTTVFRVTLLSPRATKEVQVTIRMDTADEQALLDLLIEEYAANWTIEHFEILEPDHDLKKPRLTKRQRREQRQRDRACDEWIRRDIECKLRAKQQLATA